MRKRFKVLGGLFGVFIILMMIGAMSGPSTSDTPSEPVKVIDGKYNNITRNASNIEDSLWMTDTCPRCGAVDTESTQYLKSSGGVWVQKCPECNYEFWVDGNPTYNPYYYQGFYDKDMGDFLSK